MMEITCSKYIYVQKLLVGTLVNGLIKDLKKTAYLFCSYGRSLFAVFALIYVVFSAIL